MEGWCYSVPLADHMGKNMTAQRILQCFYWPTLYKDTADYYKTFVECQKICNRTGRPAPALISLLNIEVPFQQIARYIVGLLPWSHSRKKYVLVVCDYVTQYPEVLDLYTHWLLSTQRRSLSSYLRMWACWRRYWHTRRVTLFQLLGEVYWLLHIKLSLYHPQTDRRLIRHWRRC